VNAKHLDRDHNKSEHVNTHHKKMIDLTIIKNDQEANKIIEMTKDVHREEDKIIIDSMDQGLDSIVHQRVIKVICRMIHKRCKN